MISLADLKKRVYVERQCVEFTVYIRADRENTVELKFSKLDDRLWSLFVVIRVSNSFTRVIYDGGVPLPSRDMKLEDIAATGIECFLRACNDMSGMFSTIAYAASSAIRGM